MKHIFAIMTGVFLFCTTAFAQYDYIYYIDSDKDGYTMIQGDCDDTNAKIYPGSLEICGDGIDQDCNGKDLACVETVIKNKIVAWGEKLAVDFETMGLWIYDGSAFKWETNWNPEKIIAWGDILTADFGTDGLWIHDGTAWKGILARNAEDMIVWGDKLAVDVGDRGLWVYDGSSEAWTKLTTWWNPKKMAVFGTNLAIDFDTYGLWVYDGKSWMSITNNPWAGDGKADWKAENMATWGTNLAIDFGSNGIYLYGGTSWPEKDPWTGIVGWNPENIAACGPQLAADFGTDGVYLYDGTPWTDENNPWSNVSASRTEIAGKNPENMAVMEINGLTLLAVDFGAAGLWIYDIKGYWYKIKEEDPTSMTVWKDQLAVDVAADSKLWIFNVSTWKWKSISEPDAAD